MKIKHYLIIFVIFLFLLGCQNIIAEPEPEIPDIPQPPIEKLGPKEKPLSEIMDNQLYKWRLSPGKTLYVVSVNETENTINSNDTTAFSGDIALYIGEDSKGIAHLQAEIPEVQFDLADSFLDQMTIGKDTFYGWVEPLSNDNYQVSLWYIKDDTLEEVKFRGFDKLETSEPFIKLVEKEYLQTSLALKEPGINETSGRMYQTFEWIKHKGEFYEIANIMYEDENFKSEEILHLLWLTDPKFYFDYGQYVLDYREIEMMTEGKLILDEFYLGQEMQKVINLKGAAQTTFKTEDTEEYNYLDGFTYTFDLNHQELIEIKIRGTAVSNSLQFFEQELEEHGDATAIELEQDPASKFKTLAYQIGTNQLTIKYGEFQKIESIHLTKGKDNS